MPATRLRIFISSVQKEFATLRHDLKAFLLGDAFLRRFVAEVWNPGTLPGTRTLDDLWHDHPSVPHNPLIAESLYLTRLAGDGRHRRRPTTRSSPSRSI